MGEREPYTIIQEYRQRPGEGLVLPYIYLFNMYLVNGVITDAGSTILQFESWTQ